MMLPPKSFVEQECVTCKRLRRQVPQLTCMSWYVDANALNQKSRPCFACPQGTDVRTDYARAS